MKIKNLYISNQIIVKEAIKRMFNVKIIDDRNNFIQISKKNKSIYIKETNFPINSAVGAAIAKNKDLTYLVLDQAKLPIPKSYTIYAESIKKINNIKFQPPYVIKPTSLAHGEGIVTEINNFEELVKKTNKAIKKYKRIIVQEFIKGKDYRLLVIDNKFFSAVHRIPASIIGDGINNINKLIKIENSSSLRGDNYTKKLLKIIIDRETFEVLRRNKKTLNYIPKKNEIVYLKYSANLSKGGKAVNVTAKVHNDYKKIAEKATKAIGLKFAGVDIITKNISQGLKQSEGAIIEINHVPGIDMHQFPSVGKGDDVGKAVLDMLEKYCFK